MQEIKELCSNEDIDMKLAEEAKKGFKIFQFLETGPLAAFPPNWNSPFLYYSIKYNVTTAYFADVLNVCTMLSLYELIFL